MSIITGLDGIGGNVIVNVTDGGDCGSSSTTNTRVSGESNTLLYNSAGNISLATDSPQNWISTILRCLLVCQGK